MRFSSIANICRWFQAITATGAIPIPCDVCAKSLTIDLGDAKQKLSTRTKAIMPVHYAGGVGDLKINLQIC